LMLFYLFSVRSYQQAVSSRVIDMGGGPHQSPTSAATDAKNCGMRSTNYGEVQATCACDLLIERLGSINASRRPRQSSGQLPLTSDGHWDSSTCRL